MKTIYGTILVLVMTAAVLLAVPRPCRAAETKKENIWSDDRPRGERRQFELTDERIERIMNRLREQNPKRAEDLSQLRDKDMEKFKDELRKTMREQFGRRSREGIGQRGRQSRQGRASMERPGRAGRERPQGMPSMRPGGDSRFGGPGGGPGGSHRPGGGGPGRGMIRERMREMHGEYIEWLEKNYPEKAEKLAELREEKPELYMRKIALSLKTYGRIARAAKENPKLAEVLKEDLELKQKRDKLLGKIRAASDDEKKNLTKKLQKVVDSRFDLIIKRKQIRYEYLRKKLEKIKEEVGKSEAEVEKWKDIKEQKVKERIEELVSQTEKLNWD